MRTKTKVSIVLLALLIILLALIVFALLSGRLSGRPETAGEPEETGGLGFQPLPTFGEPVYTGSDVAGSPFEGSFVNTYVMLYKSAAEAVFLTESEIPSLEISGDGSFLLTVNAQASGMREISGVVSVEGDSAEFSVEAHAGALYPGDSLAALTFRFTLINENEMRYEGPEIGTLTPGDIFARE